MRFRVSVRWRPDEQSPVCSSSWIVKWVRGDMFCLILEDGAGLTTSIPLALIEWVQMERIG